MNLLWLGLIDIKPLPGEYRSEELLNLFRTFKDQFDKNYDEVLYQKEK